MKKLLVILFIIIGSSNFLNAQGRVNPLGDVSVRSILILPSTNVATQLQARAESLAVHRIWINRFVDTNYVHRIAINALVDSTKRIARLTDSIRVHRDSINAFSTKLAQFYLLIPSAATGAQTLAALNTLSSILFTKPITNNSGTASIIAFLSSTQMSVSSRLDLIDGADFRFHGSNSLSSDYGLLYRPYNSRNVATITPTLTDSASILILQGIGNPKFKHISVGTGVAVTYTDSSVVFSTGISTGDAYLRSDGDSVSVAVANITTGVATWSTSVSHIGTLYIVSRGTYFTIFSNGDESIDNLKVSYYVKQ